MCKTRLNLTSVPISLWKLLSPVKITFDWLEKQTQSKAIIAAENTNHIRQLTLNVSMVIDYLKPKHSPSKYG